MVGLVGVWVGVSVAVKVRLAAHVCVEEIVNVGCGGGGGAMPINLQ